MATVNEACPDAWLLTEEGQQLSDVCVFVYPAGDGPDGSWTANKADPVCKLRLHANVLARDSPGHFRPEILRLNQSQPPKPPEKPARKPPAKRRKACAKGTASDGAAEQVEDDAAGGKVLHVTCYPGEPHGVPEAVLRHAYCGSTSLPDDPVLLAWMVWRADYLDMAATVKACLARLNTLADAGHLTVQDAILVGGLPEMQTSDITAMADAVARLRLKVLSTHLNDTCRVLTTPKLLAQFVQLPLDMLRQWGDMRTLKVDHENTVALLLTAWYDHQEASSPKGSSPTEHECMHLSDLIRLDRLSASFHLRVVDHLEWYRRPDALKGADHALLRVLGKLGRVGVSVNDEGAALASGGVAGQRVPAVTQWQWSPTEKELQALWNKKTQVLAGIKYFAGHEYVVKFELFSQSPALPAQDGSLPEGRTLGLYIKPRWPEVLLQHGVAEKVPELTVGLRLTCRIGIQPAVAEVITPHTWQGWEDRAGRLFSSVDDLVSFMATHKQIQITLSHPI